MIMKIDHIGVVVENLEESLEKWNDIFNLRVRRVEEIEERKMKLAHLDLGKELAVELITPLGEGAPLERFLKERGEGIHHFCFEVKDVKEAIKALKKKGVQFVKEKPQKGAAGSLIAFIHPEYLNGVLIELKEKRNEE